MTTNNIPFMEDTLKELDFLVDSIKDMINKPSPVQDVAYNIEDEMSYTEHLMIDL